MNYAIIGCGRISVNHIAAAVENKLKIVALCDLEASKAEKIKKDFNLPEPVKVYTDYHEMLKNERLDLIAIATESGIHGEIALKCLDYEANLIIEKPIALSLDEADAIIEKSRGLNLKVSACHQNRFNKSIQEIRKAVDAKRFGRLFHGTAHIRWCRDESYYKQAPWRGTFEQDGGALMNQCIHNIDLLRWMMGDEIDTVYGLTDNFNHPYIEAEDLGVAVVRFKNGAMGIIEGTTNVFPSNLEETLYLFGEKGTIKAGGKSVNLIEEWRFADGLDDAQAVMRSCMENPPDVYGFGHSRLYLDVINAIAEDREPYVSALEGRKALELVLAIYESSKRGMPVKLPLQHLKTMDYK
nr:Gfo/Idh/MocA family oxidoreductase [Fusibacter sp. 3D3]